MRGRHRPAAAVSAPRWWSREVALALVLLAGAGLLARSFLRLLQEKRGFDVDPVLTVFVSLPRYSYPDARAQAAFQRQAIARIQALPGGDHGRRHRRPAAHPGP